MEDIAFAHISEGIFPGLLLPIFCPTPEKDRVRFYYSIIIPSINPNVTIILDSDVANDAGFLRTIQFYKETFFENLKKHWSSTLELKQSTFLFHCTPTPKD